MVRPLGEPGPRPAAPAQIRLAGVKGPEPERRRRFSTLTLRILAPNVLALGVLVGGIFYLDQYRDGLLDAKIAAMQSQAEVIAGALGESALTGPEDRRRLERGTSARIIRRLVVPTRTRARLYLPNGGMLADSRALVAAG
ncbi:MAG: histidine kinase, partial [Rhodospirillaceae bacterium]|nr:histidine kinase [Rhodospirillaceae bacterium]